MQPKLWLEKQGIDIAAGIGIRIKKNAFGGYCYFTTLLHLFQKGKGKFWRGKVNEMHNFCLTNSTKYQSNTAEGVTEKQYLSAMPKESL